jgi:hypothetical protein
MCTANYRPVLSSEWVTQVIIRRNSVKGKENEKCGHWPEGVKTK